MPKDSYGFVGTGEITAAIVTGLSADVADPPVIFLSPRGRDVGRNLADRFPNVGVCDSNQDVLENASSIVLAVRPQIARTVLDGLSFRPEHIVISAIAGLGLERLRDWAAPARQIVRTIPLPQAAHRQSLTVLYPDNPTARELFDPLGGVIVPGDEKSINAFSAATATFAAHLDYLATIAGWLAEHEVDHGAATDYVAHIYGQLGQSLAGSHDSLEELTTKHMTPGGINEQVLTNLRHDGLSDLVRGALDQVLDRLSGQPGQP